MPLDRNFLEKYLKSLEPSEEFDKETQAGVDNARALRSATEGLANMTSMGELMTGAKGDKLDFSGLSKSAEESRAAKLANRERVSNYLKQKYDLTRQADKEDPTSAANVALMKARAAMANKVSPGFGDQYQGLTADQAASLDKMYGDTTDLFGRREALKAAAAERLAKQEKKDPSDLRKEYQNLGVTKNTMGLDENIRKIRSAKASPAGDISLIYGFMKMMDPGSTVREGEYASAEQARGLPAGVAAAYNKALSGEKLSEQQRMDFRNQAEKVYNSQLSAQKQWDERYSSLASRGGLSPQDVVMSFAPAMESIPMAPLAGGTGSTSPIDERKAALMAKKKQIQEQKTAGINLPRNVR